MYKPNFCAECGERVERRRWRVWTNRRFCATCEKRMGRGRAVWSLVACALLVLSGFVLGRSIAPAPPPLIIERKTVQSSASPSATTNAASQSQTNVTNASRLAAPSSQSGADARELEPPTDPQEVVSICGARTKKGTPCSRRVRGVGRCWQHRGLPAMLPASRLIVQGQ